MSDKDAQKLIGRLLTSRTHDEMLVFARQHGLLTDGRIDLPDKKVRFNHKHLDLRTFRFENTDLSNSVLTNCSGEGATFLRCRLQNVRLTSEGAQKTSFAHARFDESQLKKVEIGPRTLDLTEVSFIECNLVDVTFMLAKLPGADFSHSKLSDVYFRSAILDGAKFKGTTLTRVSFEKASLKNADFTDATLHEMEQWGEPDFTEVVISDEQRYQYGIVSDPVPKIDRMLADGYFTSDEAASIREFRDAISDFAAASPRVMLVGSEYDGIIPLHLFVKLMKRLKAETVQ